MHDDSLCSFFFFFCRISAEPEIRCFRGVIKHVLINTLIIALGDLRGSAEPCIKDSPDTSPLLSPPSSSQASDEMHPKRHSSFGCLNFKETCFISDDEDVWLECLISLGTSIRYIFLQSR